MSNEGDSARVTEINYKDTRPLAEALLKRFADVNAVLGVWDFGWVAGIAVSKEQNGEQFRNAWKLCGYRGTERGEDPYHYILEDLSRFEIEIADWLAAEHINSPVFGVTKIATDAERALVAMCVAATPVAVFQELNKALNARGVCLSIAALEELH